MRSWRKRTWLLSSLLLTLTCLLLLRQIALWGSRLCKGSNKEHFVLGGPGKPAEDPFCPQSPALEAFHKARNPVKTLSQRPVALRDNDLSPTSACHISLAPRRPRGNWPGGQSPLAPEAGRVEDAGEQANFLQVTQEGPGSLLASLLQPHGRKDGSIFLLEDAGMSPWRLL